ncbi:MAG: hypothetical protein IJF18_02550 [Oscillospiraceae bacterium]|nr:hypothetical protein [Oscillospiraceae bacterium]
MKNKLVIACIISAFVLASCSAENNVPQAETVSAVESVTELTETIKETVAETTTEIVTEISEAVTDETSTEETGIKFYNLGGHNDAEESYIGRSIISGEYYCARYSINDGDGTYSLKLRIYSIDPVELKFEYDLPEGWSSDYFIAGNKGEICKLHLYRFDEGGYTEIADAALKIKDDFTVELDEDYTCDDEMLYACGHSIGSWGVDLLADGGELLISGKSFEEAKFDMRVPWFMFELDENRFVYRMAGYESIPGFGIYDFESVTVSEVPQSEDLIPIGHRDGKIYSAKGAWDGVATEVYVTDSETLETEFLAGLPFEWNYRDMIDWGITADGEKIILLRTSYDDVSNAYILSTETGEVMETFEIDYGNYDVFSYSDSHAAIVNYDNGSIGIVD